MPRPESKTEHVRLQDRNKCTINKTLRLFAKAVEILRSDEKFPRPKTLEVPLATPYDVTSNRLVLNHCRSVMHML